MLPISSTSRGTRMMRLSLDLKPSLDYVWVSRMSLLETKLRAQRGPAEGSEGLGSGVRGGTWREEILFLSPANFDPGQTRPGQARNINVNVSIAMN